MQKMQQYAAIGYSRKTDRPNYDIAWYDTVQAAKLTYFTGSLQANAVVTLEHR